MTGATWRSFEHSGQALLRGFKDLRFSSRATVISAREGRAADEPRASPIEETHLRDEIVTHPLNRLNWRISSTPSARVRVCVSRNCARASASAIANQMRNCKKWILLPLSRWIISAQTGSQFVLPPRTNPPSYRFRRANQHTNGYWTSVW